MNPQDIHNDLFDHLFGAANQETEHALLHQEAYQQVYGEIKQVELLTKAASHLHLRHQMREDLRTIRKKQTLKTYTAAAFVLALLGILTYTFWPEKTTTHNSEPAKSSGHVKNNDTHFTSPVMPNMVKKPTTHSPTAMVESRPESQKTISPLKNTDTMNESPVPTVVSDSLPNIVSTEEKILITIPAPPVTEAWVIDCASFPIQLPYSTQKTCVGKQNGSISLDIQNISGGKAPYTLRLNGDAISTTGKVNNLGSGKYHLLVEDQHGCTRSEYVVLEEKICQEITRLVFNPDYEPHVWLPLSGKGKLTIRDKSGVPVFESQVGETDGFPWDGRTHHGQLLNPGTYIYTVEYDKGYIDAGQITLTR